MAGSLTKFCEYMRKACQDWSLGYDQYQRWNIYDGGECDCSSLVIWALKQAGFDVGSASYTGNMSSNLCARGWQRLPFSILNAKAGDILLNDTHHTAAVISGSGATAKIAQASIDERGRATGGAAGDQSGSETNVRQIYTYRHGWDCILRYGGAPVEVGKVEVDGYIGKLSVTEWQKQLGVKQTGVIEGQLSSMASYWPRLTAVGYGATGSDFMKAIQRKVGVPNPTGIAARGTICALQAWLILKGFGAGIVDQAGYLGDTTACALQRSLNAEAWK